MSKIRHILSVIHYTMRGVVCFQFAHFPCDDWENIYTLSYYHHQIGSMNYYPLFRVRPWNNCVCCMSLCILMISWSFMLELEKHQIRIPTLHRQGLCWKVVLLGKNVNFPFLYWRLLFLCKPSKTHTPMVIFRVSLGFIAVTSPYAI